MTQEDITCPFCGGLVAVGSECEYCGNLASSISSLDGTKENREKKDAKHILKQEAVRTVQNTENGKWGVLDSEGVQIVPYEYDSVRIILPFVLVGKKVLLQNKEEKLLLGAYSINSKKMLIPIEYDWIQVKSYRLEDGKCFYLETMKNILATKLGRLRRVRKYGLFNGNSEVELLPCKYERFSYYDGGSYLVFSDNDKSGLCNIREGEVMLPCIYKYIWLRNKYAIVRKDNFSGLYNISGSCPIQILPILYEEISLTDNWLLVKKQFWGISNYTGDEIVPCRYDKIEFDGTENLKLYYGNQTKEFLQIKIKDGKVIERENPKGAALYACLALLCFIVSILLFISAFSSFGKWKGIVASNMLMGACMFYYVYLDLKKNKV